MRTRRLRSRLLLSFLAVTVAFGLLVAALGYFVINNDIVDRAQRQVRNDLNSAREIYRHEVGRVQDLVRLTAIRFFLSEDMARDDRESIAQELERIRRSESLDILTLTDASGRVLVRSRSPSAAGDDMAGDTLVSRVLDTNDVVAGTVIVSREELLKESSELAEQAYVRFIETPKAKPRSETEETSGMMIKAAAPVLGADGNVGGVLYGGKLINRDYMIVDKVKQTVYRAERYKGKDVGTATIFQKDLRISTNVRTKEGARAIGTWSALIASEKSEPACIQPAPDSARLVLIFHHCPDSS